MLLNKGFKKPTKEAIRQGKARLMMEKMVRVAERKLEELKKKSAVTLEEKANVIAEELYHTPGVLLNEEELQRICEESGCCLERERISTRRCFRRNSLFQFRSIDGTCNNIYNPLQGASDTAFSRLVPPDYEDGIAQLRGFVQAKREETAFNPPNPSSRFISKLVVQDRTEPLEEPVTHLVAQFGQFLDHDMDLGPEIEAECEGCEFTEQCEPIRVDPGETSFGLESPNEGECLPFRRSITVCDNPPRGTFRPREQINVLTSYIDASMVYGSNRIQLRAVRRGGKRGKLATTPSTAEPGFEDLPIDDGNIVACLNAMDCFLCGDVRCNEQVSLTMMHTLWVRQHNRLADELASLNPSWSNRRIFQEARKIVGAMIQKIVYFDYLPLVLGRPVYDVVIGEYEQYDDTIDASVPNSFATAAYRYGHSLIRPTFPLVSRDSLTIFDALDLRNMFFNPGLYETAGGVAPAARGWSKVSPNRMDEFVNSVLTTSLFETDTGPGMDLASLNIQRGRDHGLPLYKKWREFCDEAVPGLRQFGVPMFENPVTNAKFVQLHGRANLSELWIAGLSERRLPESLLGPTFACIFGITFSNARDGDRFYFENPSTFRPEQLAAIRRSSMSQVLCENTDTTNIQEDAFSSGQPLVPCQSIIANGLSLEAWREDSCFVRIGATSSRVHALEIFPDTLFGPSSFGSTNREISSSECIPVKCPNNRDYFLYLYINNLFNFGIFQNSDTIPIEFHTSRASCRASNNPAISFTQLDQSQAAAKTAQTNDEECVDENEECEDPIPDELQKKIEHMTNVYLQAKQATTSNNRKMSKPVKISDEDLEKELQDILKKMEV